MLIKDLKLMKNQGRSYIMIALVCVIMGNTLDNWGFVVGYMTGIGGLFALSSISYDEFDNGYENDISDTRLHHEIYLSDARKVAPEKLKTVIRHPIKKRVSL